MSALTNIEIFEARIACSVWKRKMNAYPPRSAMRKDIKKVVDKITELIKILKNK